MTKSVAHALLALGLLATGAVAQDSKPAAVAPSADETISVDNIIQRHIAAHGGEAALRATKTFAFTTHRDWDGKKHQIITIHQARPNLVRADTQSDAGPRSTGFDGKVVWRKEGTAVAKTLSGDDMLTRGSHAWWDAMGLAGEPGLATGPLFAEQSLLDIEQEGTAVKLLGTTEVNGVPAHELELTFSDGSVERHFLDTKSFLLLKISSSSIENGKVVHTTLRFGDYRKVADRTFNHSFEWDTSDGTINRKSTFERISYGHPLDTDIFAMPK